MLHITGNGIIILAIRRIFLNLLREQERDLDALFSEMVGRISSTLTRFADRDGEIPLSRQRELREAVGQILTNTILSLSQGQWGAWRVQPDGSIFPSSPYFRILWNTMTQAMKLAVKEQSDLMTARAAELLVFRLRQALFDPFVYMSQLPAPEQSALKRYQHPLVARRSDGRQLSERLSLATTDMLRRTTGSIDSWIAGGFKVDQMVSQLESHFAGKTSLFGSVRGGMELRRIARSEPLFAFSQVSIASAATNPYIGVVYIERGRSEPCPICDPIVNASPYELEDAPLPGYHPHCFCKFRFDVLDEARWDTDDTQWRQMMGALSPRFEEVLLRQSRDRGE